MAEIDSLTAAIAAGDPAAFGRWVSGAEPRLRASLACFARTVDTEAVLQETLLRVWQVAPRFQADGRPDGLLRLAQRIGRNLALSELRRRRVLPTEIEALERISDAQVERVEAPDPLLRRLIQRCLEALPPSPRAALSQRIAAQGGQPDTSLAEAVGMTLNTFLQNIRRARLGLQRCLEAGGHRAGPAEAP